MRPLIFAGPLLIGCAIPGDDFDRDGFSIADDDCDDLDPQIYPGAVEIPGDGIDQDCDRNDLLMRVAGKAHGCELTSDNQITCLGENELGQLSVPSGHFVEIAAGANHTCALEDSGAVQCWGDDRFGQSSPPPGEIFVAIAAAGNWSLGEYEDGTAKCWGMCIAGQPALP